MALVLIPGPDNAPSATADWDKINDVLQTLGLDTSSPMRVKGTNIMRGSVIFFAGAWYVADSDTAISGSATNYVQLTNTAGTVTAAFVASLSGVTFNRTWNGWYDSSLRLYIFDEIKAHAATAIAYPETIKNFRPSFFWCTAWSRVLSAANLARFFRVDSEVTLTGSGTWTVPSGVYWIEGEIIAPGEDGDAGVSGLGEPPSIGGDAGKRQYFGYAVTPGQGIAYAITAASTIFGGTTLLAGGGETGHAVAGGGHGGLLGAPTEDGGDGVDGEGGGGGPGGSYTLVNVTYTPPGDGGTGGLGSVRIR